MTLESSVCALRDQLDYLSIGPWLFGFRAAVETAELTSDQPLPPKSWAEKQRPTRRCIR